MHMIALGWLWVVFMMAITEKSVVAGLMTLVFYGVAPFGLLVYWLARQRRIKRVAEAAMAAEHKQQGAGTPAPDDPQS